MFLMALIAALSGTPLRQVEAASDLARSIAELGDGNIAEETDGGVGDDAHVALAADDDSDHSPDAWDGGLLAPTSLRCLIPQAGLYRPARESSPPPTCPGRRQAWLQCFLF